MDEVDDAFAVFEGKAAPLSTAPSTVASVFRSAADQLIASDVKRTRTSVITGADSSADGTSSADATSSSTGDPIISKNGAAVVQASDPPLPELTFLSGTDAINSRTEPEHDVIIEKFESDHNCWHECVRPLTFQRSMDSPIFMGGTLGGRPPAKAYNYSLDPFQNKALRCLEAEETVLVAAHTSAGKTTVAEYAIAMSLRDQQRVIYTSPIKALSNQKFRDLSEEFKDVGLLTGDVSINPNASIMVMTTEILRHMLYRGSQLIREMKWVIFDEIHYMRDRDRGVIWEETIILLPDAVRLVFLSATIPNATEFAEWICRIKHQPCHVIYTDNRPVPLQHFIFPAGSEGVHLVMDENKNFREETFHRAIASLQKTVDDENIYGKKNKNRGKNYSDIEKIVMMCDDRKYTPLIVFAFSKKEVEANATAMKKIDITTPDEKQLIEEIFQNAVTTLSEEDQQLPQIQHILPLMLRGIGIHHGGLLPIVKEVIEILFQESLLKVLFSTETFSMGVNMPAKTVVFTAVRKWDGVDFRLISAGEYVQMSGRAGRRGLDDRGLSILIFDERLEPEEAKGLFIGEPLRIESQFHLGYNMLLNLMRVEGVNADYMINRSFHQFQKDKSTLRLEEEEKRLRIQLNDCADTAALVEAEVAAEVAAEGGDSPPPPKIEWEREKVNDSIAACYTMQHDIYALKEEVRSIVTMPIWVSKYLTPGRVLHIKEGDADYGLGVLYRCVRHQVPMKRRAPGAPAEAVQDDSANFVLDCFLLCDADSVTERRRAGAASTRPPLPKLPTSQSTSCELVPCKLKAIQEVSMAVIKIDHARDFSTVESRKMVHVLLTQLHNENAQKVPPLDPINDMHINDPRLTDALRDIDELRLALQQAPLTRSPHYTRLLDKFGQKVRLQTELKSLTDRISSHRYVAMRDGLKGMRRTLKRLDYVEENFLVTVKGRVACEISAADELVTAELLFQNMFDQMEVDYVVATLSALVFEEKCEDVLPKDPILLQGFTRIQEIARKIAEVSNECRLPVNVEDAVAKFKPALMELTLGWMRGAKFADLLGDQSLFEGSVVRALRRLEELLRQLASAAKSIGNDQMEQKFIQGIRKLKRGIVFAASLYL